MVPRVVRPTSALVAVAALLFTASGCAKPIEPATLEDKPPPVEPIRTSAPAGQETPETEEPTPTDTTEPVDVCAMITAADVRQIFARKKAPTVEEPTGEPLAIPGASAAYRCSYRWAPGETSEIITISVMRKTGASDPQAFVDSVLGPKAQAVGGVGDAAGIDRQQTFGQGVSALVAATPTDDGVTGLLILGPQKEKVEEFAELARTVLAEL